MNQNSLTIKCHGHWAFCLAILIMTSVLTGISMVAGAVLAWALRSI